MSNKILVELLLKESCRFLRRLSQGEIANSTRTVLGR